MAYGYAYSELLNVLNPVAPAKVAELKERSRWVENGLLSVGLKIHCRGGGRLDSLVDRLGGHKRVLEANSFRETRASYCLVLPPIGSASRALSLLDCIATFTGHPVIGHPDLQIQVCSPGRLTPERTALLAIAFYLGSDTLRRYELGELETTFSNHSQYACGRRIVLYDACGEFDGGFAWWGKDGRIVPALPMEHGRTDLLAGTASALDIENINLIASLLVHSQFHGFWEEVGARFELEMRALLGRHLLSGLIEAPWAQVMDSVNAQDMQFFAAIQELTAYAFEEAVRVRRPGTLWSRIEEIPARRSQGILQEVRTLLAKFRDEITARANSRRGVVRHGNEEPPTRFDAA